MCRNEKKKTKGGVEMIRKRSIISLMVAILAILALTACTGGGSGGGKTKTYVMEAEYIDLSEAVGAGMSSEASGVNMIWGNGESDKAKGWSSGYYVGFTYSAGLEFNFEFNSDKDATSTLILRLGSEIGDVTFTPESLQVKMNGEEVTYTNLLVYGSDMADMKFDDFTIASNLNIKEGKNTITITILDNTLRSGQIGGPMIDCIKIRTNAELTWADKLDNPAGRGQI